MRGRSGYLPTWHGCSTGKSEVINAVVCFAKNVSNIFGWVYNGDVVKVPAFRGAAVYKIPNGTILQSEVCVYINKVTQDNKTK